MIITLLVLITTVNAIITPGFNVGIDLRKDGAIESATVVSPDGNIFYILTDTKLIAINTNNRQKIGSFSFALDEKPIKFVVDHTNNFAYVFLDDMIEYKIFLKEISITIGAGPSVTFASTGRLLSLPNRMELSISQISNLIFTQMPTAFVSEPLRRIFYWENIAIPTSYTLRAIDAVTFTILGGTPPRLTSDGLYCWAIINQYSSANPAILVQIDLTNLSFIKNIYITSWISTSAGELIMTINQAQNTVYWTQVYGTTSQNIWKGVIAADGSISVTPLGPVGILGLPREMQLNNSDTQLVMSTVGVGGYGAVNVLVFSTVNGSLIGRTTLTSANYPWLTAFDGALILQKNLAIFTTKRSYQWIYPSAIFSANIANLVGTVTNRDNPVVVLDNLMFRTDTFFFSHDNSQLFVIGYNDSNYGINILSLNPTTFAVNSRYFYALTGTIWSWPIFMSSAVNSAASTFSLFYYIQGLITNIVISYTGGVLTLHPSTRPWVYVPVISYVTDPGVGATDIANGRQIVVGPSGFLLNLNNLTNIIGNFTTGTNNGGKLFLDASGNSGYYHNRLIFQMDFSTNFPTFVSNSSSSVTFFDFSMGSTYGVGLANGVLRTISKSNLTSVLSNFYWTNYRLSPDLFLFDPTSQIGFIHSVRFSQSGAYWAGIGGALLPIITTGGTLSQNSNGIELIFTGDELIKKVLRRPDNTFLFLSQKGYIYTFSASTVTSCTGAYCRLSSSLPATTQSFTTGGITTRGITTRSVTSGSMTTGIVTSGSITTGSVTTGDFTPGTCGGNMTSPTGTFSRYPYPASDYCIWYFDFGAGYSNITFTFTVFDLDNFWDDFRIYNSRDIIGIYSEISSPPTPQPFTTQQSYATILFDAGPFTPRTGFIINYRANSRSGIPTTGLATSGAATSGKVTSGYAVTTGVNGGLVTTGVMDSSSSSSSSSTEGTTGNEQESVSALLAINISLVLLGLLI